MILYHLTIMEGITRMIKLNEREAKIAELLQAGTLTEDMLALILAFSEFSAITNRVKGISYKATGAVRGVSIERARQLCAKACRKIQVFIDRDYITIRKIDCRTLPIKPKQQPGKPKPIRKRKVDPDFKGYNFNVTYADLPLPIKRVR